MKNQSITITLIISFLLFIGCDNSEKKFNEAKANNTIRAYEQFIDKFPNSEFTTLAKNKIDSIAYVNTKSINGEYFYYKYATERPDSKYAGESWILAESMAFEDATEKDTESGYLYYVKKYPGTENEKIASRKAAESRYLKITEEYSEKGFQQFIIDYPNSELVEDAKKIIDDIQNGRYEATDKTFISYNRLIEKFNWDESYNAYICGGGTGTLEYLSDGHLLKGSWCIGNLKFNGSTAFKEKGITLNKGTIMNYPFERDSISNSK